VDAPIISATHNSAVRSYRLAWGLWLVLTLLDVEVYRHILTLGGGDSRGVRLALLFLLQAIWLPIYLSRKTFESAAEAVIRSAAAAVTYAGLVSFFPGTVAQLVGIPVSTAEDPRLQLAYVISILLLNGVVAGTALGMLRWRIVREQPTQPVPLPTNSGWKKDLRSQLIWIACATLSSWFFHAYAWATANSLEVSLMQLSATFSAMLGRLPGAAGLLFITPIPFLLSPREGESRSKRILKYSLSAFVAACCVAAMISLPAVMWAPVIFPYIFLNFCVPSLLWGVLYGASLQSSTKSPALPESRYSPFLPERRGLWISSVAWWSTGGYACALLVGWLATTPVSLGLRGAGCLNVSQVGAAEYSFWKAYKGFASEVETGNERMVRLSTDPSVCMTLDRDSLARLSAPDAPSGGYVIAARVWSWLIDPEEWQSDRSKHIRSELTRLLGPDFSSYDELQAWWELNGEYLVWSGSGERLEVRDPDSHSRAEQGISPQRHNYVPASTSKSVRQAPWLFGPDLMMGHPSFPGFNSLFLDREARLHALKLYAADNIQILTGERARRVREYLHSLTGVDFATEREWSEYFSKLPPSPCIQSGVCPWNVTELDAHYWDTPPDPTLWDPKLRQPLRPRPDDFIPWLLRPQSEHYAAQEKARDLDIEVNEDRRSAAVSWLKNATDQSFDSPETWVRWWQENHSTLILSDDGFKLVIERR
jgi:hypothetical protein